MQIVRSIFREYDIRGIAGVKHEPSLVAEYEKWYGKFPGMTINLETSKGIGMAYGTMIKRQGGKKVVVGFEMRPYAEDLKNAFIEGILETGISVDDADKTATPFIYFITSHLNYDGGVNITGSHNIYFYNGFKMLGARSVPIYGTELQKMCDMILADDFDRAETKGVLGSIPNVFEQYRNYVVSKVPLKRKLRIAIDCGNGTPGLYVTDLFTSLGCEIVKGLYLEPDAYFPNHIPDPEAPQNMVDLQKAVLESKADIGIAFDADGDRAGFINEKGELISADDVLLLLAQDVGKRLPGHKVLFDVKSTQLLEDMLPGLNLKPLMYRTGHAPIKDMLRKDTDIALAGEVSGHFYFVENYVRADDGFFAAAQVLRILSEHEGPFSALFDFIPKRVRTPEIKLPCNDEVKFEIIKKIVDTLGKQYKAILIDGIRINFSKTGWALARASNTSPYLTLRFEAETKEEILKMKNIFADVLDPIPEIGDKLNRTEVASQTGRLGFL